jgi:hypothetical protein
LQQWKVRRKRDEQKQRNPGPVEFVILRREKNWHLRVSKKGIRETLIMGFIVRRA